MVEQVRQVRVGNVVVVVVVMVVMIERQRGKREEIGKRRLGRCNRRGWLQVIALSQRRGLGFWLLLLLAWGRLA